MTKIFSIKTVLLDGPTEVDKQAFSNCPVLEPFVVTSGIDIVFTDAPPEFTDLDYL